MEQKCIQSKYKSTEDKRFGQTEVHIVSETLSSAHKLPFYFLENPSAVILSKNPRVLLLDEKSEDSSIDTERKEEFLKAKDNYLQEFVRVADPMDLDINYQVGLMHMFKTQAWDIEIQKWDEEKT